MGNSNAEQKKVPFFKGVKSEFHKITWTDSKSLFRQSVVVAIVTIVIGAVIAIVDYLVEFGLDFLFGLGA